jgi:hypothetical protein
MARSAHLGPQAEVEDSQTNDGIEILGFDSFVNKITDQKLW